MAFLVDCAPEIMVLTFDRQHDLVEMPFVAPSWLTPTQLIGILLAEPQSPLADRLVGHDDTPAGNQLFDVAKTERKTEVEPYYMADDLARVTEAAVKLGICHPGILTRHGAAQQVDTTVGDMSKGLTKSF